MIIVTTDTVPARKIIETKGIVFGKSIQVRDVIRDVGSSLKNLVGGNLVWYEEMVQEAIGSAKKELISEAKKLGADAIVRMRFKDSSVMEFGGAAEVILYGTAVKLEEK